ncbi:MAG: transposase [Leptospiraceae bacterium]|nr:transposase [Leptospiraceae bacterium]
MKTKRKFSPEERLSILKESEREGRSETLRKYNLSPSLLTRWQKKYLSKGVEGLKNSHRKIDPKLRELEMENELLKKVITRQALELEVKNELLKKTPLVTGKR